MLDISIIIPVYNCEKYLEQCLDSILCQKTNYEVIIINDGSTDKSRDIIKAYEKKHSVIKAFDNVQNKGEAFSRNRGVSEASGKYIMFVDADDWIEEDATEKVISRMEQYDADMMFVGCVPFDEAGERRDIICSVRKDYNQPLTGLEALKQFINNSEQFMYLCTVCYKAAFVKTNGFSFKSVKVGLGGDFILNALFKADKVVTDSSDIYRYRQLQNSISHNADAKQNLLKGQFEQYYSAFSELMKKPNSEELQTAVEFIFRKMIGGIRNNTVEANIAIRENLDCLAKKVIFDELAGQKKVYGNYDFKDLSGQRVIIYGIGHASLEVLQEVNRCGIEIIGFSVTKKPEKKVLFGHRVYEINELISYAKDATVLIAANSIYEEEIKNNLRDLGFEKVLCLGIKI